MDTVRDLMARAVRKVAPRTVRNLEAVGRVSAEYEESGSRLVLFEREVRELRRELDALRRENRRVVELYDAVFDYVRAQPGGENRPPSDATSGPA